MKDFTIREDGYHKCNHCPFATPHERNIWRHVVRKHGCDPAPEPVPFMVRGLIKKEAKETKENKPQKLKSTSIVVDGGKK
jgi:hypothetical protein